MTMEELKTLLGRMNRMDYADPSMRRMFDLMTALVEYLEQHEDRHFNEAVDTTDDMG